jgi:hypothetical protein
MVRSSSIIFSFLMQSLNSMIPDWNQWVGAGIILSAIFVNTLQDAIKKITEAFCQKFWCSRCCRPTSATEDEEVGPLAAAE